MPEPRKNKNGVWSLVVYFRGKRKRLTLGKIPKSEAIAFSSNIDLLCDYRRRGDLIPPSLAQWAQELSPIHFEQLGDIGLVTMVDRGLSVGDLIKIFLVVNLSNCYI